MTTHQKITVQRLIEPRPANVPEGWPIFNAPRPLVGDISWQSEFRHGVFFVAIDPGGENAKYCVKRNSELDAWLCEYVTEESVMEWLKVYCQSKGIPEERVSRLLPGQVREIWFPKEGRREIDVDEVIPR